MTRVITLVRIPYTDPSDLGFGDITWGYAGTPAAEDVADDYAAEAHAEHHDHVATHVSRLLDLDIQADDDAGAITDALHGLLPFIEDGAFDHPSYLLAKHDPRRIP
ncbi:hypothetical protein [Pseudolysinimonas sp.]|uniref:hypothetical protein n=1 Tax=Pseudolysinimonas sp. TaxID=2680009 RepID=UPI003F7CE5EA